MLSEFNIHLSNVFDATVILSEEQQTIILMLYCKQNVACDAPSGWMKSTMLYLLAHKVYQTIGMQTILTAENHLQENELVLAERLGLRVGVVGDSVERFDLDPKKDKYDLIFVPYSFFCSKQKCKEFANYFNSKIAYWGVDHPCLKKSLWPVLRDCNNTLGSNMFLMSKEGYENLDLNGFLSYKINQNINCEYIQDITLKDSSDKLKWLCDHSQQLNGQGLVYCNDENMCRIISKLLRKRRVKAEEYIDVCSSSNQERVHYLTNSFSNGGLPILVTTQNIGTNLTNPNLRFVIHFDMPKDMRVYRLHVGQLGQLATMPTVINLHST